jgi:ABC-type multidrug transport system fused ATPase/permease subunit
MTKLNQSSNYYLWIPSTIHPQRFGLRASTTLHQALLKRILGAPMSFFDVTPIGRIVSRFSKDMYQVDNELSQFFQFFLFTTLSVVSTLGVISFSTPFFMAAIPPLGLAYYAILQRFRPVTREMKRLEAISRSPIYAGFSETLGGLSTIRAFGEAKSFNHKNSAKVDLNIQNFAIMRTSDRWLGLRLEFVGSLVAALAALFAVIGAQTDTLDASQAGVSLTLSFSVTTILTFTVRSMAELESGMNAVERLTYYSTSVDQEGKRKSDQPPAKSWPTNGEIVLKNLNMRYRKDTPLVIKNVSLTVQGGHRVGVVGRTGSGKSSLMMVLLRLVEPEFDGPDGPILIDGVDITKIGLLELRRKISIVPQNPVIFSGTVRSNLDPFNEYSDANIWDALDKCNLKNMVSEYNEKLQHPVSEYGENFSQGQRQLLCLARALLENCKVLMLDEATSSVDFETDELIQKTIRSEDTFGGCTVLTIAHRINTVIDSDRILVLDAGSVAEYDEPSVLLADHTSIFSSMASGREAPA